MQPLFVEAGAALLDCQGFEFSVAFLLLHLSRLGIGGLKSDRVLSILDNTDPRTAGQLVAMLRRHAEVSESIEAELRDALMARNYLVHRVLIDNVESIPSSGARETLVKEIRSLRSKVQIATKALIRFNEAFSEALDGVDVRKIELAARESLS